MPDGAPFVNRFHTAFKTTFFAKRDSWIDVNLGQIPDIVGAWVDHDLIRGAVGVHLKPAFLDADGRKYYWPCIDIEDPAHHGDVAANIKAAQLAVHHLDALGLLPGLQIMLTGRGFRFVWPILIPHEYGRAFMGLIEDLPFADPAPFKNGFVRLIAYRGHTGRNRQDKGKPPPDIHTQLLSDPAEVFRLTEAEYRRSVSGRLPSGAAAWLGELLPKEFCPRAWGNALAPFQARQRLNDAIVRIPKVRSAGRNASILGQVTAHLDAMGITHTEQQAGAVTIFKLSACPACSREDTGAWVGSTGRLKCWSTSCQAGARGDHGEVLGMSPAEWIPGFEDAGAGAAPIRGRDFTGLDDSRRMIADAISGDDDLLITATPGAGKTTTTLMGLCDRIKARRVVFAVPTVDKSKELLADAGIFLPGANVRRITGRGKRNCSQFDECKRVALMGFSPWQIVCFRCPDKKAGSCSYLHQFEDRGPGLVITTHDAAGYFQDIEELIVDEDSTAAVYREESFSIGELMAWGANYGQYLDADKVGAIFKKITDAAEALLKVLKRDYQTGILYGTAPANIKPAVTIREAAGLTDDDMDVLGRLLSFFEPWPDESAAKWQWRLYSGIWADKQMYPAGTLSMKVLVWLETLLSCHGAAIIEVCRRPNGKDPFRFAYTQKRIPDVEGRLIVLDGTGAKADYDQIFGRDFRLVDAAVSLEGCRFIHHQQALGKGRMTKMPDKELAGLLAKASSYLKPEERRILIATHMSIEDRIKGMVEDAFPDRTVDVIHFNGSRGLNAYQKKDAVILLGTFTKKPVEAWKRAVTLHSDPAAVVDCIQRQSDAENLQTLHRIRPVNGGKTVIVMGREWIPGLPAPGSTISTQRGGKVKEDERSLFDEAYARIERFFRQFGFITKGVSWFLGVGSLDERSDVEHLHAMMLRFLQDADTPKNWVVHLTKYILLGEPPKKRGCLILSCKKYWRNSLDRLQADHPDAGIIETAQGTVREVFTPGIGTVEKARAFYRLIGTEAHFKPELWRQVAYPSGCPDTALPSGCPEGARITNKGEN